MEEPLSPKKRNYDDAIDEDETDRMDDGTPQCDTAPLIDSICPICNRHLHMDNAGFNHHVDDCLTKVEVKAILQEQRHHINHPIHPNSSVIARKKGPYTKSLLDYYHS
jgi:DNA polymerase kappa